MIVFCVGCDCVIVFCVGVGLNAVPGGYFPLPAEVAHLMRRIPPPQCFNVSRGMHSTKFNSSNDTIV